MSEEIQLGKDWKLVVDLGKKYSLVRIFNPDGVIMEEQEFTKGFWRRSRKKKKFKKFLKESLDDFRDDYNVPNFGEEECREVRMQISKTWEEKSFGEDNEVELPFKQEDKSEEIKHAGKEILESPKILQIIHDAIHKEQGIVGETSNSLLTFFVMLSTLSEEPVNMRVSGRGSTGKSTMVTATVNLFPNDMILVFTSPTKRSLYYDENLVEEIDNENRYLDARGLIMVILEEENSEEFLEQLKELLGHDKMLSDMPFAVGGGGGSPTTHHLWMYGWPSYVGVTTKPVQEETQSSRTLLTTPNRGSEKYSAANKRDAYEDSFPWFKHGDWRTKVVQEAVKNLERYKVWNPFSVFVEDKFPSHKKARMMRDWDRLSSLMKTVTLLFQKQRRKVKIRGETHLVTAPIDVEITLEIAKNAMVEAIQGLDQDVREFYLYLRSQGFSELSGYKDLISEYSEKFNEDINRTTLRERYVKKLEDRGLIEVDDSGRTNTFLISGKNLEKMEDLRKKLGSICNREMEEKVKSAVMERLERCENIKELTVAKGLYDDYGIELSNPGVTEEELQKHRFDEEYKEEVIGIIENSFSLSRSESSTLKNPLNNGDKWIKGKNSFKIESSINSISSDGKKKEEDDIEISPAGDGEGIEIQPKKHLCDLCVEEFGEEEANTSDGVKEIDGEEYHVCDECARERGWLG